MNAKQFVQFVANIQLCPARLELGECDQSTLDGLITAAREILANGEDTGERKKERLDREKALATIEQLKRARGDRFDTIESRLLLVNACVAEATRLQQALDSGEPYQLKRIFRRKET